ncbi:Txe/YoeB family addiction module toxin [Bacteroidales bacterium OttesenSCG-928-A17]|nr:Txe/YoeB family addiction module toxin [Bacteroidales bacterium OttesenSCG-928-A17]
MIYTLKFTDQALKEIGNLKKSDKNAYSKLVKLLLELGDHPYTGTGKPKKLTADLLGYYSRRITKKHRLVYTVYDQKISVLIVRVEGHYNDK